MIIQCANRQVKHRRTFCLSSGQRCGPNRGPTAPASPPTIAGWSLDSHYSAPVDHKSYPWTVRGSGKLAFPVHFPLKRQDFPEIVAVGRAFPPPSNAFPPPRSRFPPQGNAFPPQGNAFPPQGNAFPPPRNAAPPHREIGFDIFRTRMYDWDPRGAGCKIIQIGAGSYSVVVWSLEWVWDSSPS